MRNKHLDMLDNFPFLTIIGYADNEHIGIIQNIDNQIASLYAYDKIHDEADRKIFLSLGEEWWWETNRKLPINIALLNRWPFAYTCQSFSVKQMTVIAGPQVKLNDQITKRIKRRSINLLKNNP